MKRDKDASFKIPKERQSVREKNVFLSGKNRLYVIGAALLALFLGALDTLIMGAAMPTIVSDLGGIQLYSWVFSVYLLSRAVSLPIFGKLCDLFNRKKLYLISIIIFLISSVCAGASHSMTQLTVSRAVQGVGAGGNFALAYIVLADISPPERRGKMPQNPKTPKPLGIFNEILLICLIFFYQKVINLMITVIDLKIHPVLMYRIQSLIITILF